MAKKNIDSRIQHKHDIEANWQKANNFIPLAGELIIYDADENHSSPRLKIGDGTSLINLLKFFTDESKADKEYVDSKIFIGTKAEYETANAAGTIAIGTLVCITDDDDEVMSSATTAMLGTAILGTMILGAS